MKPLLSQELKRISRIIDEAMNRLDDAVIEAYSVQNASTAEGCPISADTHSMCLFSRQQLKLALLGLESVALTVEQVTARN